MRLETGNFEALVSGLLEETWGLVFGLGFIGGIHVIICEQKLARYRIKRG
jgi:hypothetical protein